MPIHTSLFKNTMLSFLKKIYERKTSVRMLNYGQILSIEVFDHIRLRQFRIQKSPICQRNKWGTTHVWTCKYRIYL